MTEADLDVFTAKLAELQETLDAAALSESRMLLYFEDLREFPLDQVLAAIVTARRTRVFFPKIAELRETVLGISEDAAETAWLLLRRAMSLAGSYSTLVLQDGALAETIVAMFGSWPEACAADFSPEMWTAKRKEFGRIYRVLRARQLLGPRVLVGLCQRQNEGTTDWLKFVPVAKIGDDGSIEKLRQADAALALGGVTALRLDA